MQIMAFLLNPYNDSSIPSERALYGMERASYRTPTQKDFKPDVAGWNGVLTTPTLHIFKPVDGAKVFVVAIRPIITVVMYFQMDYYCHNLHFYVQVKIHFSPVIM